MFIVVRQANHADASLILGFIKELAKYEKAEHEVIATQLSIEDSIFGKDSSTKAIICEKNGVAIGFAVYFLTIQLG